MKYKYSLVVSRYYNSYYLEMIEIKGMNEVEYKTKLKNYIKDLLRYKNNLSDFVEKELNKLKPRHDFGSSNGLYILHFEKVNELLEELLNRARTKSETYKVVLDEQTKKSINKNHSYFLLRKIYERYFES